MQKSIFILWYLILHGAMGMCQSYLTQLKSPADFHELSGLPISSKYGQIDAVKLVYDLKTGQVYFLNAQNFEYHHEFCSRVLKNYQPLGTFNNINYTHSSKREYLLANVNYVTAKNSYFLELSPSDLMSTKYMALLYQATISSTFLDSTLPFIINSHRLQIAADSLTPIPILKTSDLFADLKFQCVSKGQTRGTIRYISNLKEAYHTILPTDIIVIDKTPLQLPKVAGIIVTEFQTPLSHLSILGKNRHLPIMALKLANTHTVLRQYENKPVLLQVTNDSFQIKAIEQLPETKARSISINLKFDLSKDSIIILNKVHRRSYKYIGNKAYNFSQLVEISRPSHFKTPESAFAIPFYYYNQHIKLSGAMPLINKLLVFQAHHSSPDSIQYILKEIRNKISYFTLDKKLVTNITRTAKSLGHHTRFRFRSSTNAEDMVGFSGAGLYTSKTGIIDNMNKPIDDAIKDVWASLWSYAAYMEREYYGINQRTVYMGVLVHRSFPEEEVNGVAITKNLYRDSYFGYVVNAQIGNEMVVKPSKGVICDQFICYPSTLNNMYDENNTIEIITTSSLLNGNLVMTENEILNLANQLERIKKHFYNQSIQLYDFQTFAMDIEFKIDGANRTLYIKQARKFNP